MDRRISVFSSSLIAAGVIACAAVAYTPGVSPDPYFEIVYSSMNEYEAEVMDRSAALATGWIESKPWCSEAMDLMPDWPALRVPTIVSPDGHPNSSRGVLAVTQMQLGPTRVLVLRWMLYWFRDQQIAEVLIHELVHSASRTWYEDVMEKDRESPGYRIGQEKLEELGYGIGAICASHERPKKSVSPGTIFYFRKNHINGGTDAEERAAPR